MLAKKIVHNKDSATSSTPSSFLLLQNVIHILICLHGILAHFFLKLTKIIKKENSKLLNYIFTFQKFWLENMWDICRNASMCLASLAWLFNLKHCTCIEQVSESSMFIISSFLDVGQDN